MLQILGTPGDTCSRIRLLLQNSFEDVKLPVGVENRRCSHGLKAPCDTIKIKESLCCHFTKRHLTTEYAQSQTPQTENTFSSGPAETDDTAEEFKRIIQNDILINLIRFILGEFSCFIVHSTFISLMKLL